MYKIWCCLCNDVTCCKDTNAAFFLLTVYTRMTSHVGPGVHGCHLVENLNLMEPCQGPCYFCIQLRRYSFIVTFVAVSIDTKTRAVTGSEGPGSLESDKEEELDLLYDPVLNCYYDPQTCKYYELA